MAPVRSGRVLALVAYLLVAASGAVAAAAVSTVSEGRERRRGRRSGVSGAAGPGAFVLIAAEFAGFLLGFPTGNAESQGTNKQTLGLFAAVFGGGGLVGPIRESPRLGWLVIVVVTGPSSGRTSGTGG